MIRLQRCQACLKTLSDPTRAKILQLLAENSPQTVNALVSRFTLRQPTISHHLHALKTEQFVTSQKKGNEVYYSINRHCHHKANEDCFLFTSSA